MDLLKLNKDDLEQALIKCEKRELASKFVVHLRVGVYAILTPGWEYVDLRAYFLQVAKEEGAREAEGGELKDHPMVSVGSTLLLNIVVVVGLEHAPGQFDLQL